MTYQHLSLSSAPLKKSHAYTAIAMELYPIAFWFRSLQFAQELELESYNSNNSNANNLGCPQGQGNLWFMTLQYPVLS